MFVYFPDKLKYKLMQFGILFPCFLTNLFYKFVRNGKSESKAPDFSEESFYHRLYLLFIHVFFFFVKVCRRKKVVHI